MSLSIAQRILLGFAAVIVVMVALGLYAIGQLSSVREATDGIIGIVRQLLVREYVDGLPDRIPIEGLTAVCFHTDIEYRRDVFWAVLSR